MFYCLFIVFEGVLSIPQGNFFLNLGGVSGDRFLRLICLLRFTCLCHVYRILYSVVSWCIEVGDGDAIKKESESGEAWISIPTKLNFTRRSIYAENRTTTRGNAATSTPVRPRPLSIIDNLQGGGHIYRGCQQ
jgi:hypothetical protein